MRSPWLVLLAGVLVAGCSPAGPRDPSVVVPAEGAAPALRLRRVGTGPDTVVVLSGALAAGPDYLVPLLEPAGARATFLLLEGRGRGPTPVAAELLGLPFDVADLERVRRHLGLARVRVLAHGVGARVALQWAKAHQGEADRVALLGPAPVTPGHVYALAAEAQDTAWVRRYVAALALPSRIAAPAEWCRDWWPGEFQPLSLAPATRADSRLRRDLCAADSTVLARRLDLFNAMLAGQPEFRWPDSTARRPLRLLVMTGDSLPTTDVRAGHHWHSALIWAAGADSGAVWPAPGADPVFPWLGREATAIGAVLDWLVRGQLPHGARAPLDADAAVYDAWVGRERRREDA